MRVVVSARAYFRVFATIAVLLTLLSFAVRSVNHYLLDHRYNRPIRWFDVDEELSVSSWFSSTNLAVTAALVWAIVLTLRQQGDRRFRVHWIFLAIGFLVLSIDEAIAFHELAGSKSAGPVARQGLLRFAWVVPALVIIAGVALFFLKFVMHLSPRRRRQFIVAGALFVGGAVGLEMIGGKVLDAYERQEAQTRPAPGPTKATPRDRLVFVLEAHCEEFLEMIAIVLFNAALIEHLSELTRSRGLALEFLGPPEHA